MESVALIFAFFVGLVTIFAFGYFVDYLLNRKSDKNVKRLNK